MAAPSSYGTQGQFWTPAPDQTSSKLRVRFPPSPSPTLDYQAPGPWGRPPLGIPLELERGVHIDGIFVTELASNTFTRLSVRDVLRE